MRFLNTNDIERGHDDFSGAPAVREWLVAEQLIGPSEAVSGGDVRALIEFREALRQLASANHTGRVDERSLEVLNRVTEATPVIIRFGHSGADLISPGPGVQAALARLAAIVFTATADGSFGRLKACLRESCRWAYLDRSRNRSRSWCSMAVCGNRTKAETYRERHATG